MTNDLIIRPSSLSDWVDCRRRYAARHLRGLIAAAGYTVGEKRPAHIGALVGTGLHAGAAHTLIARLRGTDAPAAAADEVAVTEMRLRMEAEGVDWDDVTRDLNTAEKQLLRMSRAWRQHVAPQIRPRMVEERLDVQVADGIIMSGQLDVADTAGAGGVRIRDTKTTKQRRSAHAQLGAYALLLNSHGYEPQSAVIDHIPRCPIREEQPVPETREIALRAAVEDALQAVEEIGRDVAEFRRRASGESARDPIAVFPANPASALCSARFCPAWGTATCRAHV